MEASKTRAPSAVPTTRVAKPRELEEEKAGWARDTSFEEHRPSEGPLRRLISCTISHKSLTRVPSMDKPRLAPPPPPDPPATRLLRTLLGDTVPPEPPESADVEDVVDWWEAVTAAVETERSAYVKGLLDRKQLQALGAVCEKARATSTDAIPELYMRFEVRGLCLVHLNDYEDAHARIHFTTKTGAAAIQLGPACGPGLAAGRGADHHPR